MENEGEEEDSDDEEDNQDSEAARLLQKIKDVMSRALQSLPKADHSYILTQKAIEEYKAGECEMGRTSFDQMISQNPKRGDLWNVYLDMELKYGNHVEVTRRLFERALRTGLKVATMKGVFLKFLKFEKQHGDEKRIETVKKLAQEYVQAQMQNDNDEEEVEGEENELQEENGDVEL